MIELLAFAAAATMSAPDRHGCYSLMDIRDKSIERERRAMCNMAFPTEVRELVSFRNVRAAGPYICGEMNEPWDRGMSGFLPFAWLDDHNWAQKIPGGYALSKNGDRQYTEFADNDIRRAQRRGNAVVAAAYVQRKVAFEREAREMLSACAP